MKIWLATVLFSLAATAQATDHSIEEKVQAALSADSRPEADKLRDANRKPLETLTFFGLKDDMRVLEMIPGGGWYTRILAPVLATNGKLYVALGTGRVQRDLLNRPGFDKVELLDTAANMRRSDERGVYLTDRFDFGVGDLDMVLTFRNLHNFPADVRRIINEAAFKALRSGGRYGVVDHTRRHMQSDRPDNRRRLDPVLVIRELEDVGFEFVDFADLHYREGDRLDLEVGHETVTGKTDRFTLLFRKP